jgi:AsmA protein
MSEPPRGRWPRVLGAAVLVVVLLGAIAILALDRILLSRAREHAAALSRDLGRPVAIGGIRTKLWGGLGVRVTDVAIGAGEGEDRPLAQLRRAEVEADLLRALRTFGRELHVREAILEGLHLHVLKLPDGTTNVERVANALAAADDRAEPAAPGPAGAPPGEPALRVLRVDRAAVEDARITFLDRSVPGAEELVVDDLDVEVRDLETGRPLEVLLHAAVLAERRNVMLRLKTAPLSPTLEPVLEELVLEVEPVVLDPLAPFVPAEVGFRGGRFQADLAVKLGAAAPGGSGPTRIQGGFRATRLVFAAQEGGRALDARLDADLEADVVSGDLRIGRLDLAVGDAVLTGKGRASGLRSDAPRFDGLEIVGRNLDLEALAAHYPPLRRQLGGVVVAGPVGLAVRGSGTQAAQTAEVRLDLTPVRLLVPGELAKAAGAPLVLVLRADVSGGGDRVRFDANAELAGVDLRPGGTLAKAPGDPLSMRAAGSYRARGETREIRVDQLDVAVLADRLRGKADIRLAGSGAKATTTFEAELQGDRLDLDRLLLPAADAIAGPSGAAGPAPAAEPLDPAAFAGLSGTAALRLGTLRVRRLDARDVVLRVRMEGDQVRMEEARFDAFGGRLSAAGTHLALARPDAPFEVALDLRGVAGEEVLRLFGDRKVLAGRLDAALKVGGTGWSLGLLTESLTGALEGTLRDGSFLGRDLVASVAAPLAERLPFAAQRFQDRGATALGKEVPFALRVADGVASLSRPLRAESGEGALSVEGGVRFDGTVEMPVTLSLSPELVARITGGRARPRAPIPVTFRLAGPAWRPRVEALALDPAVRAIAEQAAAGAIGRAVGVEGESVEDVAAKARAEAEARAREEAERTRAKLEEEAERSRAKLEEEARKRLRGVLGR